MAKSIQPARKPGKASTPAATAAADRLPALGLGAVTALALATPFVPSEGVAELAVHMVLAALWLAFLVGWLLFGLSRGNLEIRWHATLLAVLALVGWIVVAGLACLPNGHPRFMFNELWQWVNVALLFLLATQFVRHPAEARALTVALVCLALVLASYGLYQYFYSLPKTRAAFEANPNQSLLAAGIAAPEGSAERKHYVDRLYSPEPFATFSLTNSLAGFLAPWLVMCLLLALAIWRERGAFRKPLLTLGLVLLVLGYCLLLTKSRSGVLATCVGIGLTMACVRAGGNKISWKIPLLGAAALGVLLLATLVASSLDPKLMSEAPKSVLVRLEYWRSSLGMIADHPLVGCGPGNFQDFYTQYKLPEASETVKDPHNFLMELWANSGTPALLLFGVMFLALAYDLRRPAATPPAQTSAAANPRAVAWGAAVGLLIGPILGVLAGFGLDRTDLIFLLVLAYPAAGGVAWSLRGWVQTGALPESAPLVAITVLLVNLLAAGSLAYPGVGLTLWMLLAIALANHGAPPRVQPLATAGALTAWGGASLLAVAFVFTGYLPNLNSRSRLDEAALHLENYRLFSTTNQDELARGALEQAIGKLDAAARADTLNSDTYLKLAAATNAYWIATEKAEFGTRFELAAARAIKLRPHAAQVYAQVSDLDLAAYRACGEEKYLTAARQLAQRAVELYPTSNYLHAQLAWICFLAGDREQAQEEASAALRLDELLPHTELKLRARPPQDTPPKERLAAQQVPPPAETNLEQLMQRLRNSTVER